jgi:sentrin-specific protease 7
MANQMYRYSSRRWPRPPTIFVDLDEYEDEDEDENTSSKTKQHPVVRYPQDASDAVELSEDMIKMLWSPTGLDDSVIDFYLRFVHEEKATPRMHNECLLAPSFFYSQLSQRRRRGMSAWSGIIEITRRPRKFVLVPANTGNHWTLVFVVFDSAYAPSGGRRLLRFDSAGQVSPDPCLFVWEGLGMNMRDVPPITIVRGTPRQMNLVDCGLFMLEFAERILTEKLPAGGSFLGDLTGWFVSDAVSGKREEIAGLILLVLDHLSSTKTNP